MPSGGTVRTRRGLSAPEITLRLSWVLPITTLLPLFFLFASPSRLSAANTETTTASGLSGATTAAHGDNVQVFSVGLTGDGTDDVTSIRLMLSDLSSPTGIAASAFSELRIYESTDATLNIPGDTQVGSQSTINLSGNTNVTVSTGNIPNAVEYFYFGVAVIATTITDGHAFRSGFTGGFVATSNANLGTVFSAADANKVTLDVTATVLELKFADFLLKAERILLERGGSVFCFFPCVV